MTGDTNGLANSLTGNAGNNLLNGGLGNDTRAGGLGNDGYVVDSLSDVVTELANGGSDTIQTALSYSLADTDGTGINGGNVEHLTLLGSAHVNATGNGLNSILTGNAGNNVLDGITGNDTASFANANVGVNVDLNVSDGQDTGFGIDTLLNIDNLTGSNFDDTLVGDDNANQLNGGQGLDMLAGGLSNDGYVVNSLGDTIIEEFGEGIDSVQSSALWSLGANLENLTLLGIGNLIGYGNALDNILNGNSGNNRFSAGLGNDTLNGAAGNDVLLGGAGNNVLNGGIGNDRLVGGAGVDTFLFNSVLNTTTNVDVITDYGIADDVIKLENTGAGVFGTLSTGNLAVAAFNSGAGMIAATQADDRIFYDTNRRLVLRRGRLGHDRAGNQVRDCRCVKSSDVDGGGVYGELRQMS